MTAKIVRINEHLDSDITKLNDNKWQISGDAAKEVIAKSKNLEDAKKLGQKLVDEVCQKASAMVEAAHKELWDMVYKKTNTTKKDSFSIDKQHADAGLLFLIKKDKKKSSAPDGIEGFLDFLRSHMED